MKRSVLSELSVEARAKCISEADERAAHIKRGVGRSDQGLLHSSDVLTAIERLRLEDGDEQIIALAQLHNCSSLQDPLGLRLEPSHGLMCGQGQARIRIGFRVGCNTGT